MKILCTTLFLLHFLIYYSAQSQDVIKFIAPVIDNDTLMDPVVVLCEKPFIESHAKVLNNDSLIILPDFLDSICLDNYKFICSDYNHPISLRKEIIDQVKNINTLNKIIESSNPSYRKKCKNNIKNKIPFSNFSLIDLCLYRLEEIKQEQRIKQQGIIIH